MSVPKLLPIKLEPGADESIPFQAVSEKGDEEQTRQTLKQVHPISWNGEVWALDLTDSMSISTNSTSVSESEEEEGQQVKPRLSAWPTTIATDDDEEEEDEIVEENCRHRTISDSDHHQKLAKAIASKYRLGGSLLKSTSATKMNIGSRSILDKESAGLMPGSFIWALLPRRYKLPWWPAVVVARPIKRKSSCKFTNYYTISVCTFYEFLKKIGIVKYLLS